MMKFKNKRFLNFIGLISFIFLLQKSSAQNLVNVNPLTGSANINIPVYAISNGQVSIPISISYYTNGIKPKDVEGTAGMSWQLNAGGEISRQLRGLPDDCSVDSSGAARYGWMNPNNTGASYARGMVLQNNGVNCSYGTTDIANINNNISFIYDTEPDIFNVNAPGLSCQLIFDAVSGKFRTINYQDIIISYTLVGGTAHNASNIASFTITNNRGIRYTFSAPERVSQTTKMGKGNTTVNYFTTAFKQYQNTINYTSAWKLTNITDATGNGLQLTYGQSVVRNSTDPVMLYLSGATTQSLQYSVLQAVSSQLLYTITKVNINGSGSNYAIFNWNGPTLNSQTGQSYINTISTPGRFMKFNYGNVAYTSSGYTRAFLTSFVDEGCGTPIYYQFSYNGVNISNGTTSLADSTTTQVDYWGYYSGAASATTLMPSIYVNPLSGNGYQRYAIYNGATPGAAYSILINGSNRVVSSGTISNGALTQITNAQGGTTSIVYEPNDYFDVPSGLVVQGGGIRVKQIINSASISATNNIVTNYSYLNPTGVSNPGLSSGTPISLPQFAFTIPSLGVNYRNPDWPAITALSATDLSTEDHTIMYAYVKESQTGAGSTMYNYNIPATYWSNNANPICNGCSVTEWTPTINLAANGNCANYIGPITNLNYSYPFIPNPNYDFERGLPVKIIAYNDNGFIASETDYTYQRAANPLQIVAFKAEDGASTGSAKFYNQYRIFYNTNELPYTVTKKLFDSKGLNVSQTTTTTYTYGSAYHKLLTKETVTNSDNSTITSNFSYVNDYSPGLTATNLQIKGLIGLQQLNINTLVESYQQITRNGTTLTTGASLTLFAPSTNASVTNYLPSQQLKWVQPDGAAFTPFSINTSAQTISYDPKYFVVANFDTYDNTGYLLTADDNNKNFATTDFDQFTGHTTAVFKNAKYNEVAFNDFDSKFSPSVNTFVIGGTGSYTPPIGSAATHAGNYAGISANTQTITSSLITKNTSAQNYIFSIWISAATSGKLTFTGSTANPILNYNAGTAYYEIKIPASTLATTFNLGFTSNQNISIDDVLLYPDVAEVNTATFDNIGFYKIAETNTNGVSAYYTNDNWGRVLYAFDQDHNIVSKKQYINASDYPGFLKPTISVPIPIYHGYSVNFYNATPNFCRTTGMTFTWNFGDGTAVVTTTSDIPVSHTYASNGSYTISETVNSPIFGTTTGTALVNVISVPLVNVSYTNYCNPGGKVPSKIASITFSQGSVVKYTFLEPALLAGATITPGVYTIQINPQGSQFNINTNPTGYLSIGMTVNGTTSCWAYGSSLPAFSIDLTNSATIAFNISNSVCSGVQ